LDYRLKKEKDFNAVFKKGKRLFSSEMTVLFIPSNNLKFGIAVGKKIGGSVKRNKVKRLFRESFRSFAPNLDANFFFVFIPKVKEEYNFHVIKEDMARLLKKGGFID
jgi:ribonuclease P protein component